MFKENGDILTNGQNPKFWSLWEMFKFAPDEIITVITFLELSRHSHDAAIVRLRELGPPDIQKLTDSCKKLELRVALKHIDDIYRQIARELIDDNLGLGDTEGNKKAAEIFLTHASAFADTVRRDMSTKLFLAVTAEQSIELFENAAPFDDGEISVNTQFPDAVYDIQEAANCLALSRPSACVFHLMRVLEVGLMHLAADLDVKWNYHEWQNVIDKIRHQISEIERGNLKKSGDTRADKRYYSGLATQFEHFKDAWRNHAIHVHGVFYDEPKARMIYLSVREFMRELGKGFSSVTGAP